MDRIPFDSTVFDLLANEATVRELVCHPLLLALGFSEAEIRRDPTLQDPFMFSGSGGKRVPITLRPDYLTYRDDRCILVLDAKAPSEMVDTPHHVHQAYSYAVHPEVRAALYALCNGRELAVWRTADSPKAPSLRMDLAGWPERAPELFRLIAQCESASHRLPVDSPSFDYSTIALPKPFRAERQSARRHYGVHPYFTRQPYTVVQGHIEHFTKPGDFVLDPFGGSGITAIEAMMLRRKACHVDINPLSAFIVRGLTTPINLAAFHSAYDRLIEQYRQLSALRSPDEAYPKPASIQLPRDADVPTSDLLFTEEQTRALGIMKHLIAQEPSEDLREVMLLCFSGVITKLNRTYHQAQSKIRPGGDAAPMRYYRYRVAKDPTPVSPIHFLSKRQYDIAAAKREIEPYINTETIGNLQVVHGSATQLDFLPDQSVDYIYTDPPYGAKIPYLDLSALWLSWLDLAPSKQDYDMEAIQGGSQNKDKTRYNDLMRASIREMHRVLKYDRWLSFVYSHKDPTFWHMIVEQAEACGFEYRGAVSQPVGKVSFKKRQRPFTVLSGQLILHFYKSSSPVHSLRGRLGTDVAHMLEETIGNTIIKHHGATIEQINDAIIIRALEQGFLDQLQREYQDLAPLLADRYDYHESTATYHLRPQTRFADAIPLESRIRYFLTSILRRENPKGCYPTSDQLILDVLPLLKNGNTPEGQTILRELQEIAHIHMDGWRLNEYSGSLF